MTTASKIHFETYGHGAPLVLGYPLTASKLPDSPAPEALRGYLERLSDRYRVLVVDYPNVGRSEPINACDFTAERACTDVLQVANASGFRRFAWWGYSWSGILGLLLAGYTDRLTALVCGGWPPLGELHRDLLDACRATARIKPAQQLYVTFYESLQYWREADWIQRLSGPRLVYAGAEDVIERAGIRMATTEKLRAHRGQLEAWGWHVEEIPRADHDVWTNPAAVVPVVRPFLDQALGTPT